MNRAFPMLMLILLVACGGDPLRPDARMSSKQPRIMSGFRAFSRNGVMNQDRSKRAPIVSDIAFGLAHQKDLDGAVAWLVRDPAFTPASLVVVQKEELTDNIYVVARNLMRRDIQSHPVTDGRRIIKIYRDRHVEIVEGGASRTAYFHMSLSNVTTTIAPEMLRRHDAARKLEVAGIGEVRLVFEPTRDIPSQ